MNSDKKNRTNGNKKKINVLRTTLKNRKKLSDVSHSSKIESFPISNTNDIASQLTNMSLSINYEYLGEGVSGVVIYPAIPCPDINIDYSKYVGKISHRTGKNAKLIESKEKLEKLPNEFNNIAYVKEMYICYIEENPGINLDIKFPCTQVIIPRISGDNVLNIMKKYSKSSETKDHEFMDLLIATINFYDIVVNLTERKIFYNDYDLTNIMYDPITHKLMLIDFDDITYEKPKYAFINPVKVYLTSVVFQIIDNMIDENYFEDDGIIQDRESCARRRSIFQKYEIELSSANSFAKSGFEKLRENIHQIYLEMA